MLSFSKIFEYDFTRVSVSDPLDTNYWNVDINDDPTLVGNLEVGADGPNNQNVCEMSANTAGADWSFQYWVGNAPSDIAVKITIANMTITGGGTAIAFYRSIPNSVGVDSLPGGCYQCSIIALEGNTAFEVRKEAQKSSIILFQKNNPQLVVQSGDTFMAGAIGNQHFIFYNDIQVAEFQDLSNNPYTEGGRGTAGLGITNNPSIPDVQFFNISIFQCLNSNWSSSNRDFINKRGLR